MIELTQKTPEGTPLSATFLPERGMNLASFKVGSIEIIDQSTEKEFEKRCAGLGPLIGPHFHKRDQRVIPHVPDLQKFPHIKHTEGDPFSHGVARYAPWKNVEWTNHSFQAFLQGEEEWNGVSLKTLEGQDFSYSFAGTLLPDGLHLDLSVVSETDSIVGIHYYYCLPNGRGEIGMRAQKKALLYGDEVDVKSLGTLSIDNLLTLDLEKNAFDHTLFPNPDPLQGEVVLTTDTYRLYTSFTNQSEENSCQIWHPKGASFVCIEPNTAWNPRRAHLSVSAIHIHLKAEQIG